jgi:hypothetical protein
MNHKDTKNLYCSLSAGLSRRNQMKAEALAEAEDAEKNPQTCPPKQSCEGRITQITQIYFRAGIHP